ncbi:hypothetical protein OAL71_02815 [Phycisphaerales bacterium]|nr:hypothetical protein [Phycisphaerales bacterium]
MIRPDTKRSAVLGNAEAKARLATIAGAYNAPNASEEQTLALQIE